MDSRKAGRGSTLALLALVCCCACSSSLRRFPPQEPLWLDPDQRPFDAEPEEYFSPFAWDAADQTIFRPVTRVFAVDPAGEAVNINAVDEVPDSSWFRNRIGRYPMSPEQVGRGACQGPPLSVTGSWVVTGAKPNGANPGFLAKADDGRRFLVKFDGTVQGPRATAADVIGSRVYHAAGYYVPCNEIVVFDRSILSIAADATGENEEGDEEPLTEAHLDQVFAKGLRLADGRYRASTSLFVEGKPIGPWTYQGVRADDPNDVVPHEERRELRGSRLLAAWLNHFDAREQNTLATWIQGQRGGYVRHYVIDFGDCLGSIWEPPMLGRRIGHANYLDLPETAYDFVTLGLVSRPWDRARFGASGPVLGYYDVQGFDPEAYQPGYPNPAFGRASERDQAWMARIIARFTDDHVRAIVRTARFGDADLAREVARILSGRRDKILRRYLSRLSPLARPVVEQAGGSARLCLEDLAVATHVVLPSVRTYHARAWLGDVFESTSLAVEREPRARVCVKLPAVLGYQIVDIATVVRGTASEPPARVHLYHVNRHDYRVVGLERPDSPRPPG